MNNIRSKQFLNIVLLVCILVVFICGASLQNGNGAAPARAGIYRDPAATATLAGPVDGVYSASPAQADDVIIPGAWRNLRPTESYLHGVSLLPTSYSVDCTTPGQTSKGWAVGEFGTILTYCNGLWDHAITVESIPTDLYAVQAISPTLGVAVGDGGAVLMYLWDRIALDWVWTKSPIPVGNQTLYGISIVPDGAGNYEGWAVGHEAGNGKGTLVYGTITPATIGGHPSHTYTWENVTASYPSLPNVTAYYAIQMLSPDNGWAVGGVYPNIGVIIHWDGTRWSLFQQTGAHTLYGISMRSATDGWAVGQDGVIYHYNGATWSLVESPTTAVLTDVGFLPNGEGWIVGYDGTFLKYTGSSWTLFTDLRTDRFDFRSVDFSSGHGWTVGANFDMEIGGQILEYDERLWLAVTPPTDNKLNDVSVVSDNDAWAVGANDEYEGTIIHWDGKHWQRWYQAELPIPKVALIAVDMASSTDGWAAGAPMSPGGPAVFLHWDGNRWEQPRYDAPVNVNVNDIDMLDEEFGWAVADDGNAVAKYDGLSGYWSANHTCGGSYYTLRGASMITSTNIFGWEAFAVGSHYFMPPQHVEYFLRYMDGCSGGYAWDSYDSPNACPPPPEPTPKPTPSDGPEATLLFGIKMRPDLSGYAVGEYKQRASIYIASDGWWGPETYFCQEENSVYNPSRFYAVDIIKESGVAWIGGYYTDLRKVAYLSYIDSTGRHWGKIPFPINGRNIYHRPIKSISMSSDTMGWAVGDSETQYSVIYQYPFPNFTLSTSPEFRAVMPGASTTFTATVYSLGGFNANVSLSLQGLSTGMSANITPEDITTGQVATIQINTTAATPLGVHELLLRGYSVFHSGDYDVPVYRYADLRLTVTNRPIYSVSPDHGPANTVVTITGANFGADPGPGNRSTATNHVILAGKQMPDANVLSWSDTQITVKVPDSPSLFPDGSVVDVVSVTSGGSQSNEDYRFHLESHLDALTAERSGNIFTITLTGTGFGTDPGALFRSTSHEHISLGDDWIDNDRVLSWSNNMIVFTVDFGTRSGFVTVTVNGFKSNTAYAAISPSEVFLPLVRKR
jgi:photosystem II stability/assembly factor-like uncharacterized protein